MGQRGESHMNCCVTIRRRELRRKENESRKQVQPADGTRGQKRFSFVISLCGNIICDDKKAMHTQNIRCDEVGRFTKKNIGNAFDDKRKIARGPRRLNITHFLPLLPRPCHISCYYSLWDKRIKISKKKI
jgi:hypothetical protein